METNKTFNGTSGCELDDQKSLIAFESSPTPEEIVKRRVKTYRTHIDDFPKLNTKHAANFHIKDQIEHLTKIPKAVFLRCYVTSQLDDTGNIIGSLMMIAATDEDGRILGKSEELINSVPIPHYNMFRECCGYPPSNGQTSIEIFKKDPFLTIP